MNLSDPAFFSSPILPDFDCQFLSFELELKSRNFAFAATVLLYSCTHSCRIFASACCSAALAESLPSAAN